MKLSPTLPHSWLPVAVATVFVLAAANRAPSQPPAPRAAPPDLSGLAWIKDNAFLAVHDAKAPGQPRVSVVLEPQSPGGPLVRPLKVNAPDPEPFDLESIARIPGEFGAPPNAAPSFLLVESGSNPSHRRIFVASYKEGDEMTLRHVADLPKHPPVADVEGSAVYRAGNQLVLAYADRATGERRTTIHRIVLSLEGTPRLGHTGEPIPFSAPEGDGPLTRQISAMEFDSSGRLYAATAVDPNVDTGPFRSYIWRVGWVRSEGEYLGFEPEKEGDRPRPLRIATVDGMKVESLAVREAKPGVSELFFGTDDEFYGGALRSLGVVPR